MPISPLRAGATGMAMGTADLVPGVSGGTIALVGGVYDDLIDALAAFDGEAVRLLLGGRWGAFATHVNLRFLAPLLAGIALVVILLSGVLHRWLEEPTSRALLFAFFGGLVVASVAVVARHVTWGPAPAFLAGAGTAIGVFVVLATPARTPETAIWAILGGALAICAMILPGISGSFILLLVGQYERAIEAVAERDLATVALFGLGAVVGLLVMVRILRWALHRFHDATLAVLVGFMVGSLPRLWPWDACIECARPEWFVPEPGPALAGVGMAVVGAVTVLAFERWATNADG